MKKWLMLLFVLPLTLVTSGCEDSNGWDAIPVGDSANEETCYQITEWHYDGWDNTKYYAKGIYCPAESEKEN